MNLGNEGNIFLNANNLFLDNQSKITTSATNDSRGGNTFINLNDNLVTKGNSRIVASAIEGQGGNIQIQTRGLFSSFNSQIDADSKFGVDGEVQIDTFDVNPNSGLIKLPDKPIDPSLYLTRGCGPKSDDSLVNLGRGGLSENPFKILSNKIVLPDLEISESTSLISPQISEKYIHLDKLSVNSNERSSLVEAEAWKINQKGNIEMVAIAQKPNLKTENAHYLCQ